MTWIPASRRRPCMTCGNSRPNPLNCRDGF